MIIMELITIYISMIMMSLSMSQNGPSCEQLSYYKPLKNMTICIDPGHGGQDDISACPCLIKGSYTGGTVGAYTGQSESDVNLRVAFYLRDYLQEFGAKIVMTRDNRCKINASNSKSQELQIRKLIAERTNSNLFISIHHNESKNECVNYTSTYYYDQKSYYYAAMISQDVAKELHLPNYGHKKASFSVIKNTKMPSVLVEASFLSNYDEDMAMAYYCCIHQSYERAQCEAFAIAKAIAKQKILYDLHIMKDKQDLHKKKNKL